MLMQRELLPVSKEIACEDAGMYGQISGGEAFADDHWALAAMRGMGMNPASRAGKAILHHHDGATLNNARMDAI